MRFLPSALLVAATPFPLPALAQDGAVGARNAPAEYPVRFPIADPASPSITVGQFVDYLSTESGVEFGLSEGAAAADLHEVQVDQANFHWEQAVEFEWGRCLAEEAANFKPCPFLVCHGSRTDDGGVGVGGGGDYMMSNSRSHIVSDAISEVASGEVHLRTVYADRASWCGFARMNATEAARMACPSTDLSGNPCTVTPFLLSMKLMPNTVNRMKEALWEYLVKKADERIEEMQNGGGRRLDSEVDDGFPKVDLFLCPGVIDETFIEETEDFLARAEYFNSDRLDITDEMTKRIFSSDDTSHSSVFDSIYWTSSRAGGMRGGVNNTERGGLWQNIAEKTGQTDACEKFFRSRIVWTADLRPPPEFSILTMTRNNTGGGIEDGDANDLKIIYECALVVVAGMASSLDVCALEVRPEVQGNNVNAQWMVQSGVEGQRPWFDHGLDGTGQVVAVSDSGLDVDNCFFWDKTRPKPNEVMIQVEHLHRRFRSLKPHLPPFSAEVKIIPPILHTFAGSR